MKDKPCNRLSPHPTLLCWLAEHSGKVEEHVAGMHRGGLWVTRAGHDSGSRSSCQVHFRSRAARVTPDKGQGDLRDCDFGG